ncbi:MAG: 8-amino-7-oxononanoate synthase [Cyclobacteriaceae bacterium]|nr:8-amino-7-oxononanoate synthase [Cyclobacteriaceae bacterium]MDH4295853.1 8-amino-7-oxononanoate synthase [Cyclobacteriaceae bacterium]MDH5249601.1 8-amino-7-oxononanoate synthase [Cyclobacteriaceae bacterium]
MHSPSLEKKLHERASSGLLRTLVTKKGLIDFTSNDYLGLASSATLFRQISDKIYQLGLHENGSGGSRLLSGNSAYTEEVEEKLAVIFKAESALIFNSGYAANLAVLSSLPQRSDTIIYDELAHASIIDGARLSLAKRVHFKHNDLADLESKIKRASGNIFIAVESVYSMDGDACPLTELVALSEKYNGTIVLDEAHSTGAYGSQGSGIAVTLGLEEKIDVRIYTFGKAMGIHGACVAGSKLLQHYLINFARPFIYTTALPSHSIAAIDCAFDYLHQNMQLQVLLHQKIKAYAETAPGLPNRTASLSAIQTIVLPGNENAKFVAHALQAEGFDVRAILSPTVAPGSERLRICLHTFNTEEEIHSLTTKLKLLTGEKHTDKH